MKRKTTRQSMTQSQVSREISNALVPIKSRIDALETAVFRPLNPGGDVGPRIGQLENRLADLQQDLDKRLALLDAELSKRIREVIEIVAELRNPIGTPPSKTTVRVRAMQAGGGDVDVK